MEILRPDRVEKLANRKANYETVVKVSIGSLIKKNVPRLTKEEICYEIEERVRQFSIKSHNAFLALNLIIRECYEQGNDVPPFWDTTFLRQLHLGTEAAQIPFKEITKLFQDNPLLRPSKDRCIGDRNIYSSGAIMMSTNIKNHLVTNFERILKVYIYDVYQCNEDQGVVTMSKIYGWKSKRVLTIEDSVEVDLLVQDVREILDLEDSDKLGKKWFKTEDNLYKMLDFFVHVNRWIQDDDKKKFQILPMSKINIKSINLDTYSMEGVFKSIGIDNFEWDKYFNTEKVNVAKTTFTRTITTNGVTADVHFWSPKKEVDASSDPSISSQPAIDLEGKRVISNDPGRTNIYYMAEETSPGTFKFYVLTRKAYYHESGINKANRNSANWNKKVKKELEMLSLESKKSLDVAVFKMYLNTVCKTRDAMWNEYSRKKWRQQQFRLYGGKKRVFANFFNKIGINKNTVFAYGAAKFSPTGKNELSVPTARAYKECAYRAPVMLIDEFRTSKAYWKTGKVLKTVAIRANNGKLKAVRCLLWCGSTICGFVNRDKNAAINILRCATLSKRPTILNRSLAKEKLVQSVGKVIKNKK